MPRKLLFLCPHNAAKGVIAMAYWNHLAPQRGLAILADSAGTEPSDTVSPVVIALLAAAGIDVSAYHPREVTEEDVSGAERIISMGCAVEELPGSPARIDFWSDVPPVSEHPTQAYEVIRAHIEQLMAELQAPPALSDATPSGGSDGIG